MKRMPNGGYTIIEVMIFLLISSALLGSTALMLSGRQERLRFTNGVESFEQKFKDVLNDVATGYYPTDQSFQCEVNGANEVQFPLGSAEQGTNVGCLFLGRATQLEVNTDNFNTYTLVGAQPKNSLVGPVDLDAANAELLGANGNPGVSSPNKLDVDLRITKVISQTDGFRQVTGIAMISEFSQTAAITNKVTGNASRVSLYEVIGPPGTFLAKAGQPAPDMLPAQKGLIVCLQQGTGNGRKAAIIIGGNEQQFYTETKIDGDATALGC